MVFIMTNSLKMEVEDLGWGKHVPSPGLSLSLALLLSPLIIWIAVGILNSPPTPI